jgi:hypothetical protein
METLYVLQTEEVTIRQHLDIFLGFEIDLDFSRPRFSEIRVLIKRLKFKKTNLPWETLYVLQTEEVTIRQHLEILAT